MGLTPNHPSHYTMLILKAMGLGIPHDLRTPHFYGRPAPGRRAHGCLPVDRWLSDGSGERSAKDERDERGSGATWKATVKFLDSFER